MKNIEIQRDGKTYCFNFEDAIKQGLLKEQRTFNLLLNEDQLAVLQTIGSRIGGSPTGARGVFDQIYEKLLAHGTAKTNLDLTIADQGRWPSIYFKN